MFHPGYDGVLTASETTETQKIIFKFVTEFDIRRRNPSNSQLYPFPLKIHEERIKNARYHKTTGDP
jgi:hypothetical protein